MVAIFSVVLTVPVSGDILKRDIIFNTTGVFKMMDLHGFRIDESKDIQFVQTETK